MVAMAQRLDPRSFCFDPHLIVFAFWRSSSRYVGIVFVVMARVWQN
jgi:hypothetical protein